MARPPSAEGAASKSEALGTRTLAQLRHDAIKERKDVLVALMPSRGAKLAEIFYLLRDKEDPTRFGAGLDPSPSMSDLSKGLVPDQNIDKQLAEFTEKWIRSPSLAAQINTSLPPLKSTPPPTPVRRDSTAGDMSEEAAALERELTRPRYKEDSQPASTNIDTSAAPLQGQESAASGTSQAAADLPARRRQTSSTAAPYPITFRSPAVLASEGRSATPPQLPDSTFPTNIQVSEVVSEMPKATNKLSPSSTSHKKSPSSPKRATPSGLPDMSPPKAFAVPYPPSLPVLPEQLVRNRLNVGGLGKKKARERIAAQNNPQLAVGSNVNTDLYKLGMSKATHSSVRSLVGQGAPPAGKSRIGGKSLTTSDWNVAVAELQSFKALERIEQLKQERTWSLRQLRKQRATITQKSHWDYVLDEMRWMAVDFKQETRWKIATAYEVARMVKKWHDAETEEEKAAMRTKTREPNFLAIQINGDDTRMEDSSADKDLSTVEDQEAKSGNASKMDVDGDKEGSTGTAMEVDASNTKKQTESTEADSAPTKDAPATAAAPVAASVPATVTPSTVTPSAAPTAPEVPRPRRYQHQLMKARAPVFDYDPTITVFDLSARSLPEVYKAIDSSDLVNELFQELPLYGPPTEPSNDPRQNRRIDESSSHHSRITNLSHLLEGKPLLVSTLQPSHKRKRSGGWADLTDVVGDDAADPLTEFMTSSGAFSQNLNKPKDIGYKRFQPAPPPNPDARAGLFEWSPEDDSRLYVLARQYSMNWDLIAHVFNTATRRPKTDERLPWDCFDRWTKRWAPQSAAAQQALVASTSTPAQQTQPLPNGAPPQAMQFQMRPPSGGVPQIANKDKKPSATPGLAGSSLSTIPKPPDMSKSQLRRAVMLEATKKAQKKREAYLKANIIPAVRKVNLSAHETHNQAIVPNITALDLSKLKAERERAQIEEMRKREHAKLYQQAQQAAMAQQAQQQALQAQAAQRGIPIPSGANMPRLPPGAVPQNLPPNQAAIAAAMLAQQQQQAQQRGNVQMSPQMQMQMQHNAGRQPGGQIPRPPSQQGMQNGLPNQQPNGQLPPMPNPSHSSPPIQHPNMPPNMQHMPAQRTSSPMQSQSPQPVHMQLSPHALQMQLQQGAAQLTPAQQQAFAAQLAAVRSASPMAGQQMPGGFPQGMTPEQQQQQLIALMRMRQNSQGSQGSVQ